MSTPPAGADRPASAGPAAPPESVLDAADAAPLRRLFHLTPTFLSISAVADGRLLDVNDAFLDITGYSRKEVDPAALRELMQGAAAGPGR